MLPLAGMLLLTQVRLVFLFGDFAPETAY